MYRHKFTIRGLHIYRFDKVIAHFWPNGFTENGKPDMSLIYHVQVNKPMKTFDDIARSTLFKLWNNGNRVGKFYIKGNLPFEELSQDWKNLIIRIES